MKRKVTLGTVSHATMRKEDLIPAFMGELKYYGVKRPAGIASRMKKRGYYETEDSDYDLEDLFDALNAVAPPYCYFGAHEGDGSDYGFWLYSDMEFEGLQVSDLSTIPGDYYGEVLEINDHGNMTLYNKGRNGRLYEVWSVV